MCNYISIDAKLACLLIYRVCNSPSLSFYVARPEPVPQGTIAADGRQEGHELDPDWRDQDASRDLYTNHVTWSTWCDEKSEMDGPKIHWVDHNIVLKLGLVKDRKWCLVHKDIEKGEHYADYCGSQLGHQGCTSGLPGIFVLFWSLFHSGGVVRINTILIRIVYFGMLSVVGEA